MREIDHRKPLKKDYNVRTTAGLASYRRDYYEWYRTSEAYLKRKERQCDEVRTTQPLNSKGLSTTPKAGRKFLRERQKTDILKGYRLDEFMATPSSKLSKTISNIINGAQLSFRSK